ncbi:hypothetical protein Syun_026326 [Stephania yunnanensis]|uniref:Uncharacterized protein n=1 Tax=Stephania yunnanensis TaxID=152371 RepID=A0AAP0EU28_9MAGN
MASDTKTPYELLYPIVKQGHETYLSNGTLVALDIDSAFDIQKPMGDFKEWRMVTFNQIRALEELNEMKKSLRMSTQSQTPYKLLYPIVKQGHQNYLSNGTLVALDMDSAFDIQKPMGDFKEWHMVTFNQIRILEEVNEIKKALHLIFISGDETSQSKTPYELLYPIVKQNHQTDLSNGSLAALDFDSAFDIQRPMGDFKEWHIVTFNQIRILEELNIIFKIIQIIITAIRKVTISHPQTPYEIYYPIVKQAHQVYLSNGSLIALDQDFAFDILKPMGDFKEWHPVTFDEIRILKELNVVKKTIPLFKASLVELFGVPI